MLIESLLSRGRDALAQVDAVRGERLAPVVGGVAVGELDGALVERALDVDDGRLLAVEGVDRLAGEADVREAGDVAELRDLPLARRGQAAEQRSGAEGLAQADDRRAGDRRLVGA